MSNFLQVDKKYFCSELKSLDILILSQIEEYSRNGVECYISNKTLSDMFGESESSVKRSIDKLESMNLIKRHTTFVKYNGQASKKRVISIVEGRFKMNPANDKLGSKSTEARFNMNQSKVQNEPIKDNRKDNRKDNIVASQSFIPSQTDIEIVEAYRSLMETNTREDIVRSLENNYNGDELIYYKESLGIEC